MGSNPSDGTDFIAIALFVIIVILGLACIGVFVHS